MFHDVREIRVNQSILPGLHGNSLLQGRRNFVIFVFLMQHEFIRSGFLFAAKPTELMYPPST